MDDIKSFNTILKILNNLKLKAVKNNDYLTATFIRDLEKSIKNKVNNDLTNQLIKNIK